jgi:hypothetical protein
VTGIETTKTNSGCGMLQIRTFYTTYIAQRLEFGPMRVFMDYAANEVILNQVSF